MIAPLIRRRHTANVAKAVRTDDMYSAAPMRTLRRCAWLLLASAVVMALYVLAGQVEALRRGEAVVFTLQGTGFLLFSVAIIIHGLTIASAERLPAVYRLNPLRGGISDLDEWERAIRRRVAESVLKRSVIGLCVLMVALALLIVHDTYLFLNGAGEAVPALPLYSSFIAVFVVVTAVTGATYLEIARSVSPDRDD